MKPLKPIVLNMLLFIIMLTACKKDEPADPANAFEGGYVTQDYNLKYSFDNPPSNITTIAIKGGIEIVIQPAVNDKSEITIDGLDEFYEELYHELLADVGFPNASASVSEKEVIAEVSGNTFEIEEAHFMVSTAYNNLTNTLNLILTGNGSLNDNGIELEFKYVATEPGSILTTFGIVNMK